MQVRLRVRPTAAYHAPNKVETITIDSHERLEKIQEKYSTAGNGSKTRLYFEGRELPLNSSVASQDFQDDDTLECCNSPAISAALSACMKDLEEVKKLSYTRRHPGVLKQLLEVSTDVRNNSEHSIWVSGNWTDDKIKARIINFAIMKAVVQRKDRWAVHDLPQCIDCQSLYDALQNHNVFKGGNGNGSRAFRSQEHLFKPFKNNGEASTNWIMLWKKIDLMKGIQRRGYDSTAEDYIEEFVRRDSDRHRSISAAINDEDAYLATHLNSLNSSSPARSLPPRQQQQQQQQHARSRNESSLMDLSSPPRSTSRQSSSSLMDLSSPQRSTSRQPSSTPRSRQSKVYFPQYASGPFSVLAALHLAMHAKHKHSNGRRLLSLTEDELKRQAQRRCRSNLYDKGRIRGRSAFACMDGLVEKQLARKEIIRDSSRDEIEKWGLLTKGERLGQFCADFDRAVQQAIPEWNVKTCMRGSGSVNSSLTLCLDNREDELFLRRLKQRCEDDNVSFVERDLPAGDYLFLDQSGVQERILPVVIERKSWSDLADSCLGKGRAAQRLECVKIGSHSNECGGNCQLDKMKRCGCSKILFIVEGERCLGSDRLHRSAPKCTLDKCCSACKSLEERHGIRQDVLEGVLTRLQVEHGCYIHYTKCFNETSQSLLDMRSLLQSAASLNDKISYETYASSARRRSNDENQQVQIPNKVHDIDVKSLASMIKDQKWEQRLVAENILGNGHNSTNQQISLPADRPSRPRKRNKPSSEAILLDDSDDDSDGGIEMLDPTVSDNGKKQSENNSIINIDDSDEEEASDEYCIDLSESQDPLPPPPNDDDFIDLCESQEIGVGHIRGGGYSDDTDKSDNDSVIELLNESQDSLPLHSGSPPSKPRKRAASSLGQSSREDNTHLLILREWSEYDNIFHKSIERAWKEMQAVANVTDDYESQQVDIYAESVVKLEDLVDNSDLPIVSRRHLMAFTLWLQLILGVQIRAVQRIEFANDIQRCLEKSGSSSVSTSRFTSSAAPNLSISRTTNRSRDEASMSKASPSVPAVASMKRPTTAVTKASPVASAAASMKRPAATSLESDLIREARLKRFSQSSSYQSSSAQPQGKRYKTSPIASSTANSTNSWECTVCTMKNDKEVCDACAAWRCSTCTYVNKSSAHDCICGADGPAKKLADANISSSYDAVGSSSYYPSSSMKPSPSHTTSDSAYATKKPQAEGGAKKPKVCGACGQEGHNRGNATQYNCTAYYDPKEVERREKLERKRLEKLDAERQKIARLEREEGNAAQNYEEWLRQTEKIKASHEQADEYRKEELKRAKQKKARMEKQQQRRNNGH